MAPKPQGFVVYRGPSMLTGHNIVVIITGLRVASRNRKTGPMAQVFYLPEDVAPHEAVANGLDIAVCGNCPLASGNGCYVRVEESPLQVWRAYHRGSYPVLTGTAQVSRVMAQANHGSAVRLGAYGDPASAPLWVSHRLTMWAKKRTGYTHQWREAGQQTYTMASVHTEAERAEAKGLGYRTFRTADDGPTEGEIGCPATEEFGAKTTCKDCGLCDGSKGPNDKRRDIFAYLHGNGKGKALLAIGG